jgi:glycopeptide antibiotics resistance protein
LGIVVFIAILALYVLWRYYRDRKKIGNGQEVSAIYEAGCLLLALYTLYLFAARLLPVDFSTFGMWSGVPRFEWMPFSTVIANFSNASLSTGVKVYVFLGNLLEFAPIGVLLPLLKDEFASYQSVVTVSLLVNVLIVALCFVETACGIASKTVTTDSFIYSVLGATIGWAVFLVVRTIIRRYNPDFRRVVPTMTDEEVAELLADEEADWFQDEMLSKDDSATAGSSTRRDVDGAPSANAGKPDLEKAQR